jgi:hypothetical protein
VILWRGTDGIREELLRCLWVRVWQPPAGIDIRIDGLKRSCKRPQLVREAGCGRVENGVELAQITERLCEIARKSVKSFDGDESGDYVMLMVWVTRNDWGRLGEDRGWFRGHG